MQRPFVVRAILATAILLASACGSSSEHAPSGLGEPLRVRFTPVGGTSPQLAQFFPGPLPVGLDGPKVPNVDNAQVFVVGGELGKALEGNAEDTATAVAFKFADLGSGFWVAPVRDADGTMAHTLKFKVLLDFGSDVPLGEQSLEASAVDATGRYGPAKPTRLIFQSTQPAGAGVATLTWDNNADLDLQIITPNGKQIDAKHPSGGGVADGGIAPGSGVLDRDSNASCVSDGRRQEDVVWTDPPMGGLYLAKVDMFSACGEPASNFVFKLYWQNELISSIPGTLLAIDADNGAGPGLAITNFQFP